MPKTNKVGTHVKVQTTNGRIRNATIVTRTDANNVTVRIGHGTPFAATMQTSNGTRAKILKQ